MMVSDKMRVFVERVTSQPMVPIYHGPGTELKKLMRRHGINPDEAGCQCNAHAAKMDRLGNDWCEANIETIVGWMREEAERRGLPFVEFYARWLVKRSIKNARR